jgi:hypothetical protein
MHRHGSGGQSVTEAFGASALNSNQQCPHSAAGARHRSAEAWHNTTNPDATCWRAGSNIQMFGENFRPVFEIFDGKMRHLQN